MPQWVGAPKLGAPIITNATEDLSLWLFLIVTLGLLFSSASSILFLKTLDL